MSYAGVAAPAVLDTAFSYFPRLHERRHQMAGTMSGGEQQMLAMSRALASDPALLILDELSMGLAPLIVDELYETVSADRRVRRLHPVHRAVRPHRASGRRLRRRDERRPGGRHRRARRDPRDHVRRHPGRGGMKRAVIPMVAAGLMAASLSITERRRGRTRRRRRPSRPRTATAATAASGSCGVARSRSRSSSPPSRSRRSRRPSSTSATPRSRRTRAAPRAGPASSGPVTASARGSRRSSPSSACRPRWSRTATRSRSTRCYPSGTTRQHNAPFPGTSMTTTSNEGLGPRHRRVLQRLQRG